jgi:hypothetical protein
VEILPSNDMSMYKVVTGRIIGFGQRLVATAAMSWPSGRNLLPAAPRVSTIRSISQSIWWLSAFARSVIRLGVVYATAYLHIDLGGMAEDDYR